MKEPSLAGYNHMRRLLQGRTLCSVRVRVTQLAAPAAQGSLSGVTKAWDFPGEGCRTP